MTFPVAITLFTLFEALFGLATYSRRHLFSEGHTKRGGRPVRPDAESPGLGVALRRAVAADGADRRVLVVGQAPALRRRPRPAAPTTQRGVSAFLTLSTSTLFERPVRLA